MTDPTYPPFALPTCDAESPVRKANEVCTGDDLLNLILVDDRVFSGNLWTRSLDEDTFMSMSDQEISAIHFRELVEIASFVRIVRNFPDERTTSGWRSAQLR